MSTPVVPPALTRLVDDARALDGGRVPPLGGPPWDGPAAPLLRAVVVPETALGTLADDVPAVPAVLQVTAGAGAVGPALVHAGRVTGLDLTGVTVSVRADEDPAANVERLVRALDDALPAGVPATIALPVVEGAPGPRWLAAVDVVAAAEHVVALRPGPDVASTLAAVTAALDRECRVALVGDPDAALVLATLAEADGTLEQPRRWLRAVASTRPVDLAAELLDRLR